MNRFTTSKVHDVTPHQKYYGRKSNLSHLQILDTIAYMHIPSEKEAKAWSKVRELHICGLLTWTKRGTNALTLLPRRYKWVGISYSTINILIHNWCNPIRINQNRSWHIARRGWMAKAYTKGKFNLNQVEWASRASKWPKHVAAKSKNKERKGKNAWIWRQWVWWTRIAHHEDTWSKENAHKGKWVTLSLHQRREHR